MEKKLCFLLTIILSLNGCSGLTRYNTNIDSISAPNASLKKKYILLSSDKNIPITDLQFQEYSKYIIGILSEKGYKLVDKVEDANAAIFLAYGIGEPQDNYYTYSVPIWGQTGYSSSTTYGTINSYGNYGTYSGTTTYNPTYGVTGYSQGTGSYTTYYRFIMLSAYDIENYQQGNELPQLWKTLIESTGTTGDLRSVFPIILTAGKDYIATNPGKKVNVIIFENDPEIIKTKEYQN